MPMAATCIAVSLALRRAALAVASWVFQIASGSCSTHPGLGKICGNSLCTLALMRPVLLNMMLLELVVP